MFNHRHFREYIIRPALNDLIMFSENAEELLIATLAQETLGGCYVHQVKGPALGIYQMEPATYDSLWANYISRDLMLSARILNCNQYLQRPPSEHLVWNMKLATMMTRVYYRQIPEALPDKNDIEGLWMYYRQYYNTIKGKATREDFMRNYDMFMGADWDVSDLPKSRIIVSSEKKVAVTKRVIKE